MALVISAIQAQWFSCLLYIYAALNECFFICLPYNTECSLHSRVFLSQFHFLSERGSNTQRNPKESHFKGECVYLSCVNSPPPLHLPYFYQSLATNLSKLWERQKKRDFTPDKHGITLHILLPQHLQAFIATLHQEDVAFAFQWEAFYYVT